MLRPSYLVNCANNLEAMYGQLESDITADIARRVAKTGKCTETSQWQSMKLREATAAYQMYLKYVKNASKYAREEVRTALIDGSRTALATDNKIYRAAGLHPANIAGSQALMDIIMAGAEKTNGVLSNMTMTTARDATWTLQQALDRVYVQVESGAFDIDTAMRTVIKDLGQKGYTHFKYDSGTHTSLEAASRRALITGLNQTVATLQLSRANDLETDLVEVSSHAGARPTHAEWQGQIYSLSGRHPHYDNFYDATEYGFGDGLCGWNCYHSFYPFVEGVSTPSFDRDPARELGMSNDELYELTQDQRYLERQVRASRRQCQTLDAAMSAADEELADQLRSEFSKAAVLLKKREAKLQQFCKQNGLPYDASRVTTFNFGRSTSAKAVWANRKAAELTPTVKSGKITPTKLLTTDDPIRRYLGAARQSHPDMAAQIEENLRARGVTIVSRPGQMAYSPSAIYGRPGRFIIDPEASISAWLHENQHAEDDFNRGWALMRLLADPEEFIKFENRAYDVEIDFAEQQGYSDVADELRKLKREREAYIRREYDIE